MLNLGGTAQVSATASADRLTFVWFAKRSVLWALIVAIGISAACGLYAVAGEHGGDAAASSGPAAQRMVQPSG